MSLNRLELKSTSAFRLRALRPWQQTRIHCQEQPETKSGEVISMCVVRPETASPQLPTRVPPTPCASGRSVQQANAVRVTLNWPHAARAAHAARIAVPARALPSSSAPTMPSREPSRIS